MDMKRAILKFQLPLACSKGSDPGILVYSKDKSYLAVLDLPKDLHNTIRKQSNLRMKCYMLCDYDEDMTRDPNIVIVDKHVAAKDEF
jgi:hypothetical protein